IAGGLAGASAPHIAEQLKGLEKSNPTAHKIAHGVLGAVVAQLQGNSAIAGGIGAAGGEVAADMIYTALYGDMPKSQLSQRQKEEVSALASIAAGLAGAVAGGSVGDVATAAGAGQNAVENNYLSEAQKAEKTNELAACPDSICEMQSKVKWLLIDQGQNASLAAGV